jgi:hypothetical protein
LMIVDEEEEEEILDGDEDVGECAGDWVKWMTSGSSEFRKSFVK